MASSRRVRNAAKLLWALAPMPMAAFAIVCPPIPSVLYVGESADANCRYASLQAAVSATGTCPATIVVTRSSTAEHTIISGKNLTIVGSSGACGIPACSDPAGCPNIPTPTGPVQTLSGAHNGGHSVLDISGTSNVALKYLQISDGAQTSTLFGGGGIDFFGSGTLTLEADTIKNNSADAGGGIAVVGNGGHAKLAIGDNVLISENNALASGGGIAIQGDAELSLSGDNSALLLNTAGDSGGGLSVVGNAKATISGSGLLLGLGVVYGNHSARGGGIAIDGSGSSSADNIQLLMYSKNARFPVRVSGNVASDIGGGIYLKSYAGLPELSVASACFYDYRLDDNLALDGSAIYADNAAENIGDTVMFNLENIRGSDYVCARPPDSVACSGDKYCNSIDGNYSVDGSNNPSGSAISISNGGGVFGDRIKITGNVGTHVLDQENGNIGFGLLDCLLADNQTSAELVYSQNDTGKMSFNNCTIVNNDIAATYVFHVVATYGLMLHESIVDQPQNTIEDYVGAPADLSIDFSLVTDMHHMAPAAGLIVGEPVFFDKPAADYRLFVACAQFSIYLCNFSVSAGVDYFKPNPFDALTRDVDNRPRDVDIPQATDLSFGSTRDLGAFEMQPIDDRVFADGFGDWILVVY